MPAFVTVEVTYPQCPNGAIVNGLMPVELVIVNALVCSYSQAACSMTYYLHVYTE